MAVPATPVDRTSQRSSVGTVLPALGLAIALVVLWELVVRIFTIPPRVLPAPTRIIAAAAADWSNLWAATMVTGWEVLLGLVLAMALAIVGSFAMWLLPWLERMAMPLLVVSQTIPIVAIAPLLIIWFGFEPTTKVLLIALFGFFPITVSLQRGLRAPTREQVDVARTLGASQWWLLAHVRAKAAREHFITGLRISVTYAPATAAAAEFVGARRGLGIYLLSAQASFRTDLVFVGATALTIMTLVLYALVGLAERLIVPWHREER